MVVGGAASATGCRNIILKLSGLLYAVHCAFFLVFFIFVYMDWNLTY
jgi:hypothetical protein